MLGNAEGGARHDLWRLKESLRTFFEIFSLENPRLLLRVFLRELHELWPFCSLKVVVQPLWQILPFAEERGDVSGRQRTKEEREDSKEGKTARRKGSAHTICSLFQFDEGVFEAIWVGGVRGWLGSSDIFEVTSAVVL